MIGTSIGYAIGGPEDINTVSATPLTVTASATVSPVGNARASAAIAAAGAASVLPVGQSTNSGTLAVTGISAPGLAGQSSVVSDLTSVGTSDVSFAPPAVPALTADGVASIAFAGAVVASADILSDGTTDTNLAASATVLTDFAFRGAVDTAFVGIAIGGTGPELSAAQTLGDVYQDIKVTIPRYWPRLKRRGIDTRDFNQAMTTYAGTQNNPNVRRQRSPQAYQ
jgi:hypothetical protein